MKPYDVKSEADNLKMVSDNFGEVDAWSILNGDDYVSLHAPAKSDGSASWVRIPKDQFNAIVDWYTADQHPSPSSDLRGLDKATMQKLREALRFSASRSVMSADDERRILAAFDTPAQECLVGDDVIEAVCAAVVLGEGENYEPVHLEPREARQAIAAYLSAIAALTTEGQP